MNTGQVQAPLFIRTYSNMTGSDGPLKGLTFTVKDNIGIANSPLSLGLNPPLIAQTTQNARVVELLLAAGASCTASTNMDELCADYKGRNRFYGNMFHPQYPELAALGSSTGAAISVASGLVDFSLGSDFGGSIRAPAASCGLYGIKAPRCVIPTEGAFLYGELDSLGLFTKSLTLMRRLLAVLETSKARTAQDAQTKRIWIPNRQELDRMEPSCLKIFRDICDSISQRIEVKELDPIFWAALQTRKPLAIAAMTNALAPYSERIAHFPEAALAVLKRSKTLREEEVTLAQEQREMLKSALAKKFESLDLILTPTLTGLLPAVVDLDRRETTPLNMFLGLANVVDCTALAFPVHKFKTRQNIPFSLQVMGDAAQIEQILAFSDLL